MGGMIRFGGSDSELCVLDIETVFLRSDVIFLGDRFIEVPDRVLFKKREDSKNIAFQIADKTDEVLYKILAPSTYVIDVENFDEMIETLFALVGSGDLIRIDSKIAMVRGIFLNVLKMKRDLIFVHDMESLLIVNGYVFTTSITEYMGSGMFTSKKSFLVDDETMGRLRLMFKDGC